MRRHGRLVWTVCRHILPSEHDAEDAFQAAFLVLARRAASIRKTEAVAEWLHGVAYRIAVRAKQMAAKRLGRERQAAAAAGRSGDRTTVPPPDSALRELQELLQAEVARLPEKYRAPFVLCCLEGRCWKEAAAELGWKVGTLATRIAQARKLLQTRLARRGVTLSAALTAGVLGNEAASAAIMLATRQAAMRLASGAALPAITAPAVVGLVETGLRTFGPTTKFATALLLVAITLTGSVTLAVTNPQTAGAPSKEGVVGDAAQSKPAEDRPVRTDAHGDPLPEGAIRRIGTLRFRHGGGNVSSLLVSPDGKTLISTTVNGSRMVFAWELATGKPLHKFPGHPDSTQTALSADGKILATCRREGVVLWDLASGRELRCLQQPFASAVAFSPDGKTLASADDRNPEIALWELANGAESRRIPRKFSGVIGPARLAFSRDGAMLFSAKLGESEIEVLDLKTGKPCHVKDCLLPWYPLILSPTSDLLALIEKDGAVPLWDASTNKIIRIIETGAKTAKPKAFSKDGKTLVIQELDTKLGSRVSLWDVTTGKRLRSLDKGIAAASWFLAAFSNDGKTLITNGDRCHARVESTIRLWDSSSGEERGPALDQPYFVAHLTLAPDGRTLAYARDRDIQLLDAATKREIGTLSHGPEEVTALAFSPDSLMLASCAGTNTVRLWNVSTRQLLHRYELVKDKGKRAWTAALAYSPDGKSFAAGGVPEIEKGGPSGIVWMCDAETGRELGRFLLDWETDGWSPIMGLAFLNTGKHLAAVSRAHEKGTRVTVWETATGKRFAFLTSSLNLTDEGEQPRGLEAWEINRIEPNIVPSRDGRLLARNGHSKILSVWETTTGKRRWTLPGHEDAIFRVAFAPDGRTLASASADETIRLWDLDTGKELLRLAGHRGIINSLVFSADGTTLISAGHDTTILFWDVAAVTGRKRPEVQLTPNEREALWKALAETDAAQAHQAIARLTASPGTVSALNERLRPAPNIDADLLKRLLGALDSEKFEVRDKATKEIEKLGEAAGPAIERALASTDSSPEKRRRLERLQSQLGVPTGEPLRELRALELLERIATPEAKQVIEKLAKGAPDARLTREAKSALQRLPR
jgi:RNA polymerase sigma factor (sigma-70 family)